MLLDIMRKGATDKSVHVKIIDSTDGTPETGVVYNTSGIALWYRREGGAKTAITLASLSALTDAHADGGFLHVGDGVYRLDLPDAAVASGASIVQIGGTVTGMIVIGGAIKLTTYDPDNDGISRLMLNADTGLQSIRSNTAQGGSSTTTIVLDALASSTNDIYNNEIVLLTGGTGAGQARVVVAYNGTTKTATLASSWVTTPDATTTFAILPSAGAPATAAAIATQVETQIIAEGDGQATLAAIRDKVLELFDNVADPGVAVIAAAVADAVCDEALSGHTTAGTLAKAISDINTRTITTDTAVSGAGSLLTAIPWNAAWNAEVQSEVQDAIEANHLDHLLAADYDPSAKPGVATALLNELIGNDGGVSQFTSNALELAPTGSGTVSAAIVSKRRTLIGEEYRARNIIELKAGFAGTLACEPDLNPDTTIASVQSVTITGAATVVATNLSMRRDKKAAHWDVPTLSTAGAYTVVVTVTTVDGQTIVTTGSMTVY